MDTHDLKCEIAPDLSEHDLRGWAYQRYIKDYLRVITALTITSAACWTTWMLRD